jgi:integrase
MAYSTSLYRVREIYYFRCRIPADLKEFFAGKEDFKRSLRTKSLTPAQGLHRLWSAKTERTFMMMRSGALTRDQIKQLADAYLHDTLRKHEEDRESGIGVPQGLGEVRHRLAQNEDNIKCLKAALTYSLHGIVTEEAVAYADTHGIEIDTESPEFAQLAREIIRKKIKVAEIEGERIQGNYDNDYDAAPVVTVAATEAPVVPSVSLMLSVAVKRYIEEAKTLESAGDATIYEAITKCNQFVKVVQDKPIGELNRADVMRFLDVLKRLPPNASKSPKYRDKTLEELLAMKPAKTLSGTTINNYMSRIKGFLEWCVRMGHLTRNPADGATYGKKSMLRPDELRNIYSKADLQKMTDSYCTLAEKSPEQLLGRPERLWLPLVALFSGMRVNEIAQLHTGDIAQEHESGIWYFNIELSAEGEEGAKRVKTAAARRMIPVHPTLISLGFIDYVKKVHVEGSPRYWMNLKQTGRGYHKSFANWFLGNGTDGKAGFLRKHVTTNPKINFHSFRHTFTDALKQNGVVHHTASELTGHAQGDITYGRYGKSGSLQLKLDVIKVIDYEVDFGGLREVARLTEKVVSGFD